MQSPFSLAYDAAISLPLGGHYRPGRYMPLRIEAHADAPEDTLTIRADGALTTEIPATSGQINATLPWLSIRTVQNVRWSIGGADEHPLDLPLHALDDEQRLIGYAGADPDVLKPLFTGASLIRVQLDATGPLPGPIEAWESLDGLVLDAGAAARIDEGQLRGLLAAGTAVAIRSTRKPGGPWPWQRVGDCWVARAPIAGPTSAYVPAAYAPTQSWLRGWPLALRRRAVLAAIAFTLVVSGITLWRSRWTWAVVVALCALASGGAVLWRARQPVTVDASGAVVVLSEAATQRDDWTYRAVLRPSDGVFTCLPLTRPVFGYRQQQKETSARLVCAADGRPQSVHYHLQPRQSLAFVNRTLIPDRAALAPTMPISSPMRAMADELFAGSNGRAVGQVVDLNATDERWPDVVIDRRTTPSAP